jgi:hypothetical protein
MTPAIRLEDFGNVTLRSVIPSGARDLLFVQEEGNCSQSKYKCFRVVIFESGTEES